MMYILGILTGILLAVLFLVIEVFLKGKNKEGFTDKTIDRVIKRIENKKGSIIFAKPDAIRSIEEKMEEDRRRGEDSNLDDLIP